MQTSLLKIIFAGSGEFGGPTLQRLVDAGHSIVQVFTQPDRPAGRGKTLTPTPIAQLAGSMGLSVVRTADINAESLPVADVMIVIAFGQKVGPAVVNHPPLGSVNLHASRLPAYRGAAPINWAVIDGLDQTGNSIIRLAEKMDAGHVLGMSSVPIAETDTAGEVHDRLSADGPALMEQVLQQLSAGTAIETPQDHARATLAKKLSRQTAVIDWTQPARTVARRINGLSPWPGCRVKVGDGGIVTLLRAEPAGETAGEPGVVTVDGLIAGGDGRGIRIVDLQPEGKKPMTLPAYRNGRPWAAQTKVSSIV